MAKLTLSVDGPVISSAKRYAKRSGLSVSQMVEAYLDAVVHAETPPVADTPILRSLRGSLAKGDREDYRKHLVTKYR